MDDADIERIVRAVSAATLAGGGRTTRPSVGAKVTAITAKVPPRTKVLAGGGLLVVAAGLAFRGLQPDPVDTRQVTEVATKAATAQALAATQADLSKARAESVTVVIPDAFAWAPLPLNETAKSIIGYSAAAQFKSLDPVRAEVVAKQARALLVGVPITQLRLVAGSPTDLRVTTNPGEGVALFDALVPAKAAAPASSPTSAVPATTTTAG